MSIIYWLAATAIPAAIAAVLAARVLLARLIDRRIAFFQSDLMTRHYEEVQNIYREMRGWRHDYHNHIQTMKAYRSLGQDNRLDEYLSALDADLSGVDELIKSGSVMVDAMLNAKLSLAKNKKISINAKAIVPVELTISEVDLCVVIGNLLDNAMEACMRLADENARFIRVYIDIKRQHLYISVTNASDGQTKMLNGRYLSGKAGYHGFGLPRVDNIIKKYGGYIKRGDEAGAFSSEVMLPL